MASRKLLMFNINERNILGLPRIIRYCLATKTVLKVFTSDADDSPLELCQIPSIQGIFRTACLEYGLLGFIQSNSDIYQDDIMPMVEELLTICYGEIQHSHKNGFIYSLEKDVVLSVAEKSMNKYKELYKQTHTKEDSTFPLIPGIMLASLP